MTPDKSKLTSKPNQVYLLSFIWFVVVITPVYVFMYQVFLKNFPGSGLILLSVWAILVTAHLFICFTNDRAHKSYQKLVSDSSGGERSLLDASLKSELNLEAVSEFAVESAKKDINLSPIYIISLMAPFFVLLLSLFISSKDITFLMPVLVLSSVAAISFAPMFFIKKRISETKVKSVEDYKNVDNEISTTNDEKIIDYVTGVERMNVVSEFSIMGVGAIPYPENSIVFTNHKIIFLVITYPGVDQVFDGGLGSEGKFLLLKNSLEKRFQELLKEPLADIVKSHEKNYSLPIEETTVKVNPTWKNMPTSVDFFYDNKKYTYYMRWADAEKIKGLISKGICHQK